MIQRSTTGTGIRRAGSARDPLWFKDAVIYALHVKTFFDANGDGVGDFTGLIERLDYLAGLGVTCLWLLPFYESPLRDDGYDIAHYERVDPRYGSLADFDRFVEAAHGRGLQVVTELVINHTSDRHPWFEASRRAPAGSHKRDFYVWSDTDRRYREARVIFKEAESSNWTWDPIAGAFYWHRFFRHQPDLNFDNPHVRHAVFKIMRFWLDRGVDGLRLDAVPHLFEREGTSCENLPETHQFLKEIRAEMDSQYENRIFVAEANSSPADVMPYFGDADECHMAFHFPLVPRLFIALESGHAAPIIDIVNQTAGVPESCQWAVFLRNHDELTLSAVDDVERRRLLAAYATDAGMRLNRGIRRRLAPLFGNDRRRLALAHALLLSLPGSPVMYYGDEIGMGDNVLLDDRHGLRTTMQWTSGAAGGFSVAGIVDPIVPPPVDDPEFGYRIVNVSAQEQDPDSPLNLVKRLLGVRRRHQAFGRGSMAFPPSDNEQVLAFTRTCADHTVLVVASLAGSPQTVTIDLPASSTGSRLEDLVSNVSFSAVTGTQYPFTLGPYAYHWLLLR